MSNNKLVIDLTRLHISPQQRQALHNAIHKSVAKQLEKILKAPEQELPEADAEAAMPAVASRGMEAAAISTVTAHLHVTFLNTNPGLSNLTAVLNGQKQSITQTGILSIPNVASGDLILLQKTGNGSCLITIDMQAIPMQVSFPPGKFNDQFFIS